MKIAIDCLHYPISPRISSHRSSWARYWKWTLQTEFPDSEIEILGRNDSHKWTEFDQVYFYHGMEWNGKLNLAGGVNTYTVQRMKNFASTKLKRVLSLEVDFPDYGKLLFDRGYNIPELVDSHKNVATVDFPDSKSIVLGDSHSLSVMDSNGDFVRVHRTDFKTLNGALDIGLDSWTGVDWNDIDQCTFFFGMIDLRHHILRHGGVSAIDELMTRYEDQLKNIKKMGVDVELAEMYPMTKDSRNLPKSGFFKGTPYYGELKDRILMVSYFNRKLEGISLRNEFRFYKQPEILTDVDGTMDEFFLEKPRSVHMNPEFYRFDLEKGETREW